MAQYSVHECKPSRKKNPAWQYKTFKSLDAIHFIVLNTMLSFRKTISRKKDHHGDIKTSQLRPKRRWLDVHQNNTCQREPSQDINAEVARRLEVTIIVHVADTYRKTRLSLFGEVCQTGTFYMYQGSILNGAP